MRGDPFHNKMVEEAVAVFLRDGWAVETEFFCQADDVTTFFDVYATKGDARIACEVETSIRHVIDNVRKAKALQVRLWVIVPSRKLCRLAKHKLNGSDLLDSSGEIFVLLLDEVESQLGGGKRLRS
jgi:hypothetical protein